MLLLFIILVLFLLMDILFLLHTCVYVFSILFLLLFLFLFYYFDIYANSFSKKQIMQFSWKPFSSDLKGKEHCRAILRYFKNELGCEVNKWKPGQRMEWGSTTLC